MQHNTQVVMPRFPSATVMDEAIKGGARVITNVQAGLASTIDPPWSRKYASLLSAYGI
jgi:hypothetical protein